MNCKCTDELERPYDAMLNRCSRNYKLWKLRSSLRINRGAAVRWQPFGQRTAPQIQAGMGGGSALFCLIGISIRNVVPIPGSLVTEIWPLCLRMMP